MKVSGLCFEWDGEVFSVTKDELIEKTAELLKVDGDPDFLSNLKKHEIETLIAFIRDRLDQVGNEPG